MAPRPSIYIDNTWQPATGGDTFWAVNPSTEEAFAEFQIASAEDVDRAVKAAKNALPAWSASEASMRVDALSRLLKAYVARTEDLARALAAEMGAPIDFARTSQIGAGANHLRAFIKALQEFHFAEPALVGSENQEILREAVGVAALITPWNWPLNQITLKVGAALAAGCTVVLKPSEVSPVSGQIFAEIVEAANLPKGVFNLVQGTGAVTGAAMVAHPDVDVVSFTGSTRAGIAISYAAAPSIKRVSLELGGKSPSIVFADADVEKAVRWTANFCFNNTGQSCNASTRMLVERSVYDRAVKLATEVAEGIVVERADLPGTHIGPLSSKVQYDKVLSCIDQAVSEGVNLITGGRGRPEHHKRGYFVSPTVFAGVTPEHSLFRDEVFGPVLAITPFDSEEEAIELANDTVYGLSAYIHTEDAAKGKRVARSVRAGMVQLNGSARAPGTPFGGYKQSGNGREGGRWGIEEFLETKLVAG
ncbi:MULTISPECIES: aldehyde dehydrogenase family protein [Rhizobium/Agrobacterium group]|nr:MULTISPECIES: aldehyde dehydrogenase family protein [Rhizobium/Agrobacterium group]MCF1436708.1 aldehyde dehydrogenase family protein [Allorhizobium ampelinum]MCF1450314.1 aldehyde dehydrogenase family protein [Allorhizobium ampelinum]MCF1495997.1 aldehyde dehydrogenase family protein [Allorhizobium ampelinum]MUO31547.1 aldehyde dehydrogenase family protein [Agrobacterium vitis]MUO45400.1 aldehyde dehydrogenase family protein [Agrobacterium vitis]